MTSNNYDFHDEWNIPVPLNKAWGIISDSADWQQWWPGLKSAVITKHDPKINGSSVELTWRSKTGYHLKHVITIITIEPGVIIHFTSAGDLDGYGSWKFEEIHDTTHMIIDWHVHTTKLWMKIFSPVLRHVFIRNHAALMKQGETGLNEYLHKQADQDDILLKKA